MKKFVSAILIAALLLALAAPAMAASKIYATSSANVRKGPGLDYGKLGAVKKGAALTYKGETSTDSRGVKWYKVSFKGKTGWISSKMSSTKKSASASKKTKTSAKNKVTATGSVNLRKGPGLKYGIIASIEKGSTLEYTGKSKKDGRGVRWYQVKYNGKTCWISSRYSKSNKSSSSSSSSSKSSKKSAATATPTVAPETLTPFAPGVDGEVPSDPESFTAVDATVTKPPIVQSAPSSYIEVSGFYQAKLIESALMLDISDYTKTDTEAPNQYSNDALTLGGDTTVEYIGLRGEGYTVYGVCINMDVEAAKALLTNAGLVAVDRDFVIGFEHPATASSTANVNGYDSCINLYTDTDGRITEIDWTTYTA
ncbi:MAG: SH3 domain-containing protein [Clostridia bacterium]|nr:SH3 domain-containing protein [Clostridia bacterium]